MLAVLSKLLETAQGGGYAVGGFNVYNLEGIRAVVAAAEAAHSPAILQVHPGALDYGGLPLLAACVAAARAAAVPVAVHLDHCSSAETIRVALAAGVVSIMADGSQLPYQDNLAFTQAMAALVHEHDGAVEAELGRLSGSEDGLTVADYEALLTEPAQAAMFVAATGVDALAVCIGNVHGRYERPPQLDIDRLRAIRAATAVPLVLHGASGLPDTLVRQVIAEGVCKLNVNTELRAAYLGALQSALVASKEPELVPALGVMVAAMQAVVAAKLRMFGSVGRA